MKREDGTATLLEAITTSVADCRFYLERTIFSAPLTMIQHDVTTLTTRKRRHQQPSGSSLKNAARLAR